MFRAILKVVLIVLLAISLAFVVLYGFTQLAVSRSRPQIPLVAGTDAIVFATFRDPGQQIYIMRDDGSYQTRLTYNYRYTAWGLPLQLPFADIILNTRPLPAPDGDGVVFLSTLDSTLMFYHIRLDGSNQHALPIPVHDDRNAMLSPDGSRVAFRKPDGRLFVMNIDGTGELCLTCTMNGRVNSIAWSPDATQLAFAVWEGKGSVLYRVHADGSGVVRLTEPADAVNVSPAWSPDGHYIAFSSDRDGSPSIYVINADGMQLTRLTHFIPPVNPAPGTSSIGDSSPAWSPDGQRIAFVSSRNGAIDIYVMHADGTNQMQLTSTGSNFDPVWVHVR